MKKLINSFIVVMPVYNGESSITEALESVLHQDYEDLGIIIKDDISTDHTAGVLGDYLGLPAGGSGYVHFKGRDILVIRNHEKMYGGGNTYDSVVNYVGNPRSIIGVVDGDDALLRSDALKKVKKIYDTEDKWLVWSQHKLSSNPTDRPSGYSGPLPDDAVIYSSRDYWSVSHFRTCRAWLYHQVRREDLADPFIPRSFYKVSGDAALLYPLIELCGNARSFFLDEDLYLYNDGLNTNENRLYSDEVILYSEYIRNKGRKYSRIELQPMG